MTEFINHADLVSSTVHSSSAAARSRIASSWRRSLITYGLDPSDVTERCRIDDRALNLRRDKMGAMLHAAQAELDRLFRLVCDTGCGLYLTDCDGIVLDHRCTDGDSDQFHQIGLAPGADCSEASEGTNGMGTCLADERPVIVHRNEHFRTAFTTYTCIAAPVFGPEGELLAALDISSVRTDQTRSANLLMADALLQCSRRIEAANFRLSYPTARILLADLEGQDKTALLAIDGDDLVVGATRAARLAYGILPGAQFRPRPAADFLGSGHSARDIAAIQKSAILRALARSSGNVSAAARQLGIGRTTLYRRMRDLNIDN